MPLRYATISRYFSKTSGLDRRVLPSTITRTNVPMFQLPASLTVFRRGFSLSADKSRLLTGPRKLCTNIWSYTRTQQSLVFRRFLISSRPKSAPQSEQSGSLSQRLKALSREYGWSALGVYLLLSAMDFPFCFGAVRFLGVEKIGHYEHVAVESFKNAVGTILPSVQEAQSRGQVAKTSRDETCKGEIEGSAIEKKTHEGASLWTQIALAYAIHKSLIFIRVPLTAVVTPKVVKALRQMGWDIVKGRSKGM
ncbi:hypothetical protein BDV28DRAFT_79908 [Aspergillus coremiiformis]|uniref:DUF1279 domain-containing protein n=1 Tax=Aspergillus coremiiformis TaxID=138285 RepID=A0A5N6YYH1_9EURO|nr:hypothetical protein BDV28DRAFT_79908 [Aspergillus coremiiformis]